PGSPPGGFTVSGTSSGADSIVFPNVFGGGGGGSESPGVAHPYSWSSDPLLAGPTSFDVKASSSGTLSAATSFVVSPDSSVPVSSVTCGGVACAGPYTSSVSVG